ncbi:MAG: FAD-dependent oxidoreductase [Hyphomicrobiales bacterium]|nr:FAD-dependent oxidoreductase [Hyphomicrobiales bacterium]
MAKALMPDICIIGSGPGALAVATGAAAYGADVVMVDNQTGHPASNTLALTAFLAAAKQAQAVRDAQKFGLFEIKPDIDFKLALAHAKAVGADASPDSSPERLATLATTVISGVAHFTGRNRLVVGGTEIRARRYVLATDCRPVVPAIPGLEEVGYLTTDTVLDIGRRPGHLVVLGGDGWGLALAQAFRRLGSQVTLVADRVLPEEDPEMVAVVMRTLRAEGVAIREGGTVTAVERRGKTSVRVLVADAAGTAEVDGSQILLALGGAADLEALDLKKARVALREGFVDVSAMLRTTNRRIYAVGGVTGAEQSAHVARHQASLVLKALLFRLPAKDRAIMPRVVPTDPELARVGQTEVQAKRRRRRLTVLRWPYADNDRARAERRTEGHMKLIVSRRGDLLGATTAGADAAMMIGPWALAVSKRLSLADMAASIPPHPSIAEIGKSAAMSYFTGEARKPLTRGIVRVLRFFG